MTRSTIHLLGGNIDNLGDELMLRTVVNRLKRPGRRFVHRNTASNTPLFSSLGVQQLIEPSRRRFSFYNAVGRAVLRRYRRRMGLIDETEVDCVIDLRGYYLGDVWGAKTARHTARDFARWSKQGKKIVALPQAYGPFTSDAIKRSARQIFELSHLAYVRDEISRTYLMSAGVPAARVPIVRDITITEANGHDPSEALTARYFCVVPNRWMTSLRAKAHERQAYSRWLIELARHGKAKGLQPLMLLHARKLDDDLRSQFEASAPDLFLFANAENAIEAKAILGSAVFVVTSRYHALIGAAAQGVPSLCTSWSHKYVAACQDFGPGAFLINVTDDFSETAKCIDACIDPERRAELVASMQNRLNAHASTIEAMWAEIMTAVN